MTVREVETPAVESAAQGRAEQINREIKRIQNFRHPEIDTEVWFVALGAELCGNSGMQAFVAEHREDLKGSIVINLEGLGAGKLTYIDHEGLLKPMKSSARMKRFLRNASQQSGVSFGTEAMCARTTPAYVAFQHGLQSMTLAGMKDGEPAFFGSMDDTMEIIDESALRRNASFVLALLKSI